jgi:hypothetical protein
MSSAPCTVALSQRRGASWLLTDSLAFCHSQEHSPGSCSSVVWLLPGEIRAARQQPVSTIRTGATTAASTRSRASCSRLSSHFCSSSSEQAYSAACGAKDQLRARRCRIRRQRPRRRDVRTRRHARGRRDECGTRGRAASRVHPQPASLLRLGCVERGVRCDAARDRARRTP